MPNKSIFLFFFIFLSFFCYKSLYAQVEDTKMSPPTSKEIKLLTSPFESWYGIYNDGKKIGWAKKSGSIEKLSGKDFFVYRSVDLNRILGSIRSPNDRVEEEVTVSYYYMLEKPFSLVRFVFESDARVSSDTLDPMIITERREIFKNKQGEFVAKLSGRDADGSVPVQEFFISEMCPDLKITHGLLDLFWSDLWLIRGPKNGEFFKETYFDFESFAPITVTSHVTGIEKVKVKGVELNLYSVNSIQSSDGATLQSEYRYTQDGKIVYTKMGTLPKTELIEETKVIAKSNINFDAFYSKLREIKPIRPDIELGNQKDISKLVLEISGNAVSMIKSISQQKIKKKSNGIFTLTVDQGKANKSSIDDQKQYLSSSSRYPFQSKSFKAEFQEILTRVSGLKNDQEKTKMIFGHVRGYIEVSSCDGALEVHEIIATKKGDCSEFSLLFTTLSRAAGLPAREVSGLHYNHIIGSFGGHAWNEVLVDGIWHTLDVAMNEYPANAARIVLAYDQGQGNYLNLFQLGLSLKVISVERN